MFDPIIDLDIFRELEEDIQPNREPVKKIVENSRRYSFNLAAPPAQHNIVIFLALHNPVQ